MRLRDTPERARVRLFSSSTTTQTPKAADSQPSTEASPVVSNRSYSRCVLTAVPWPADGKFHLDLEALNVPYFEPLLNGGPSRPANCSRLRNEGIWNRCAGPSEDAVRRPHGPQVRNRGCRQMTSSFIFQKPSFLSDLQIVQVMEMFDYKSTM